MKKEAGGGHRIGASYVSGRPESAVALGPHVQESLRRVAHEGNMNLCARVAAPNRAAQQARSKRLERRCRAGERQKQRSSTNVFRHHGLSSSNHRIPSMHSTRTNSAPQVPRTASRRGSTKKHGKKRAVHAAEGRSIRLDQSDTAQHRHGRLRARPHATLIKVSFASKWEANPVKKNGHPKNPLRAGRRCA